MRSVTVATLLLLAAAPVCAQQTTLGYDAFVAGAKVGAAEVKIETDDARYEISGKAWTVGVLNFVTQWQTMFSSTGRLNDSGPVNDGYRYIERARDKVKELMLSDGHLTYVKNGQVRSPRAPTSIDLLSALFVSRDCASAGSAVHNGKDQFSLKLTNQEAVSSSKTGATERCTFEVNNQDNERIDATDLAGAGRRPDGSHPPRSRGRDGRNAEAEHQFQLATLRNSRRQRRASADYSDLEPRDFLSRAPHRIETPDAGAVR